MEEKETGEVFAAKIVSSEEGIYCGVKSCILLKWETSLLIASYRRKQQRIAKPQCCYGRVNSWKSWKKLVRIQNVHANFLSLDYVQVACLWSTTAVQTTQSRIFIWTWWSWTCLVPLSRNYFSNAGGSWTLRQCFWSPISWSAISRRFTNSESFTGILNRITSWLALLNKQRTISTSSILAYRNSTWTRRVNTFPIRTERTWQEQPDMCR